MSENREASFLVSNYRIDMTRGCLTIVFCVLLRVFGGFVRVRRIRTHDERSREIKTESESKNEKDGERIGRAKRNEDEERGTREEQGN